MLLFSLLFSFSLLLSCSLFFLGIELVFISSSFSSGTELVFISSSCSSTLILLISLFSLLFKSSSVNKEYKILSFSALIIKLSK
jgi:hypothetical protein